MDSAPTESLAIYEKSGWMTGVILRHYLEHVVKYCRATSADPVLLILDGHSSYTKSLEVLEYASQNGLSLPPHTTHKLQPLDVSFFKPFNTYYNQYVKRRLRAHPGRPFGGFQVAAAVSEALGKAGTVNVAVNGFKKCGIWPVNEHIFEEHEFQPALTTDRPMLSPSNIQPSTSAAIADQSVAVVGDHSLVTEPSTSISGDDKLSAVKDQSVSFNELPASVLTGNCVIDK